MSVRGFTPFFKWGFSLRSSSFLVPLISNNILVSGEEAVSLLPPSPLFVKDFGHSLVKVTHDDGKKEQPKDSQEIKINLVTETNPSQKDDLRQCSSFDVLSLDYQSMSDDEILQLVLEGKLPSYRLEQDLKDTKRAVIIRRQLLEKTLKREDSPIKLLPFESFDYNQVLGSCCENVVGYVTVPLGIAGPLLLDGEHIQVPMATTEGALVASTSRGCKAIAQSGGAISCLGSVPGMTRAPVVRMPNITRAVELRKWIEQPENFSKITEIFNSTSRFGQLTDVKIALAGRNVFMRFKAQTGDAMGMNIVSKGVEKVLEFLQKKNPDMQIMSVSGNYCTDKKSSSINWTEGRGRSVVCEAFIKKEVVNSVLKTTVDSLVELNICKNLVGSAVAGSLGGFNAHASNIVTSIFIATGQDVAQNVESSSCITLMEKTEEGDLYISVTMPSVEVGTVGGGTNLPGQSSCLDILKVKGPAKNPGDHADRFAKIICGTVLAGELSLMAALAAGHLMKSHLRLNRKQ
jgi:hydroxymethylglutaryl-CoA reductase (NADPH)